MSDQTPRWRVRLNPDNRKQNDRGDHIYALSTIAECGSLERQRIALPFYAAILAELKSLGAEPHNQRAIANLQFWINLVVRGDTAIEHDRK